MGDIAPGFKPSYPQILALYDSVGKLATNSVEHNEHIALMWLSQIAPSQNFDEVGRKKTVIDSSMIDPRTRKPIPQITLVRVEDVRKVCMLFSLLLSDVKIKFNGCAGELRRLHSFMTIEQMRLAYPDTKDEILQSMIDAEKKNAEMLAEHLAKNAAANETPPAPATPSAESENPSVENTSLPLDSPVSPSNTSETSKEETTNEQKPAPAAN